jgi:alpha-1,2-mannosyltransferase
MAGTATTRWRIVLGAVSVLALAVRLGIVALSRGGPSGNFGYDPGVYYAAADALTHGRLPYRDFLLLHPPALMLALTPFAMLGRLTTDHIGFMTANTAFAGLGAVNAALVAHVGRRFGLSLGAALIGGLFYAVWYSAASPEMTTRLEPLGTVAFLFGLVALTTREPSRRAPFLLAGLAFGTAVSVKIWWSIPLLVALAWVVHARSTRRQALPFIGGVAAAFAVLDLPFFAAAPGTMWRMVVADQLGRHSSNTAPLSRLDNFLSLRAAVPGLPHAAELTAVAAAIVIGLALTVAAWQVATARLVVLVAVSQVLVLLVSPTYFNYYSGYATAALSLVLAAGAHRVGRRRITAQIGRVLAVGSLVGAATLSAVTLFARPVTIVAPFPGSQLADAVRHVRCVMADSPMALIALNDLSRDLANQCPNWVDVSGRTYDVDAPVGRSASRTGNVRWQNDLRRYLLSGDATIMIRSSTGYSAATKQDIERLPVLAHAGGYTIYRVPHPPPASGTQPTG